MSWWEPEEIIPLLPSSVAHEPVAVAPLGRPLVEVTVTHRLNYTMDCDAIRKKDEVTKQISTRSSEGSEHEVTVRPFHAIHYCCLPGAEKHLPDTDDPSGKRGLPWHCSNLDLLRYEARDERKGPHTTLKCCQIPHDRHPRARNSLVEATATEELSTEWGETSCKFFILL